MTLRSALSMFKPAMLKFESIGLNKCKYAWYRVYRRLWLYNVLLKQRDRPIDAEFYVDVIADNINKV